MISFYNESNIECYFVDRKIWKINLFMKQIIINNGTIIIIQYWISKIWLPVTHINMWFKEWVKCNPNIDGIGFNIKNIQCCVASRRPFNITFQPLDLDLNARSNQLRYHYFEIDWGSVLIGFCLQRVFDPSHENEKGMNEKQFNWQFQYIFWFFFFLQNSAANGLLERFEQRAEQSKAFK